MAKFAARNTDAYRQSTRCDLLWRNTSGAYMCNTQCTSTTVTARQRRPMCVGSAGLQCSHTDLGNFTITRALTHLFKVCSHDLSGTGTCVSDPRFLILWQLTSDLTALASCMSLKMNGSWKAAQKARHQNPPHHKLTVVGCWDTSCMANLALRT